MKRLIRRYKNILAVPALALPMLLCWGCADDLNVAPSDQNEDKGVVLYVPSASSGLTRSSLPETRAAGDVWDLNANEGQINTLTLIAFPQTGAPKVLDLKNTPTTTSAPSGYTGYKLSLENGNYKMYVVANTEITDVDTEENLLTEPITIIYSGDDVAKKGLPMSCSHADLQVDPGTGVYTNAGSGNIQISSETGTKIKADLTFAVAKVRVTMINDMMTDSKKVTDTEIKNIFTAANLFKDQPLTGDGFTLADGDFMDDTKGYHEFDSSKLGEGSDLMKLSVDFKESPLTTPPSSGAWAWQGVAYVGERLFSEKSSDAAKVNIKFNAGADKPLVLGKEYGTADNSSFGLKRSYFYDYVGTTTADFQLAVQPWDPATISGALHGEYFLHVDHTSIDKVNAGNREAIWYESNSDLDFDCGKLSYEGKEYPVYELSQSASNDSIYVSVHPSLPFEAYVTLKNQQDLWQYFTVKAGTIEKTIEVKELGLERYLAVDVENITVDVRVQISSGNYSGDFVIPVRTNLPNFTVESIKTLTGGEAGEGDNLTIGLVNGADFTSYPASVEVSESGKVNLRVHFQGLNDGAIFWTKRQTLTFDVVRGDGDERISVTISILPSVDDYKIYLYAPDWQTPHIYVYQCLKLPSTHATDPNAPVGLHVPSYTNNDNSTNSALEYSFTGAVVFRGWNVAADDGVNYNDPTKATTSVGTFQVFTEEPTKGNWSPGDTNWLRHYYDRDFCASYRTNNGCTGCNGENGHIDRDWPGVKMKSAASELGDGWWEFTLSGVAKPGQALIMFTDADNDHNCRGANNNNPGNRYPLANDPGIPLFDYPDNTGYFDVTSSAKQFVNEKPEVGNTPQPTGGKLKIYVKNDANWNGIKLGCWNEDENNNGHPYGNWGNRYNMTTENIGGNTWYVYTINKTYNNKPIQQIQLGQDDSNHANNYSISTYTSSNSEVNSITLKVTGKNEDVQLISTSAPDGRDYDHYYVLHGNLQDGSKWKDLGTFEWDADAKIYILKNVECKVGNFGIKPMNNSNNSQDGWLASSETNTTITLNSNNGVKKDGGNWYLSTAGTYTFKFNPSSNTLWVGN